MVAMPGDGEPSCREMNVVPGPAEGTRDECQKKSDHEQQKNFLLNGIVVAFTSEHDGEILMSSSEQSKQKAPQADTS